MTTLKGGKIFKHEMNESGTGLAGDPLEHFHSENRYCDIAFGPNGRSIYFISDSLGPIQGINGRVTTNLWNPGPLLLFRY